MRTFPGYLGCLPLNQTLLGVRVVGVLIAAVKTFLFGHLFYKNYDDFVAIHDTQSSRDLDDPVLVDLAQPAWFSLSTPHQDWLLHFGLFHTFG